MQQVTRKQSIGITISVVWILVAFAFFRDDGLILPLFALFGIMPEQTTNRQNTLDKPHNFI